MALPTPLIIASLHQADVFRALPAEVRGRDPNVDSEGTDAAIWTWESNGKAYGIAFAGNQSKPLWYHVFREEGARDRMVQQTIKDRKSLMQSKLDRAQQRRDFQHDYVVGDILYTSWGYEQTNVDFFEVIEVRGKQLIIRPIADYEKSSQANITYVVPNPGTYTGPAFRATPTSSGVKCDGHSARKWDGKPKYETTQGWGH